jgi:hypothetical protein
MPIPTSPMVMRSVYLPEDMDLRLRQVAFTLRRSKADIIRAFVSRGLRELPSNIDNSSAPEKAKVLNQIFAELEPTSEQERLAFEADREKIAENIEESPGQRSDAA